ncbi:MAG: urate hydroxylase PuuD [Rhodobacteraceae bacterium]|nr:urate hydroxylase PuuD [Paracoccaceae bacterium]
MLELVVIWEWLEFIVRWVHVITAIAWIGSSFYFIALDLGLRRSSQLPEGVLGEEWQVHGGGFYHVQKYQVAPPDLPQHLTWFKWESYSTWLSGFALLAILYWSGAEIYLIDRSKADLELWQAIALSGGSLLIGWVVYNTLCKSKLGESPTLLMILLFVLLVAMSWGYDQIFTGRAALLHVGAFTATVMTANVFLVIIPNQKIVVKDLREGKAPDPKFGQIGKLRSTHNNYLTLPVIFLMLSNHYPLAFASEYNWIICSLIFLTGVLIRHYFNSVHARRGHPHWTWALTAVIIIIIMWLSALKPPYETAHVQDIPIVPQETAETVEWAHVMDIVNIRCMTCHMQNPSWEGFLWAPKNVLLETKEQILYHSDKIYLQAAMSNAMPPANVTYMTQEERAMIANWYAHLKLN